MSTESRAKEFVRHHNGNFNEGLVDLIMRGQDTIQKDVRELRKDVGELKADVGGLKQAMKNADNQRSTLFANLKEHGDRLTTVETKQAMNPKKRWAIGGVAAAVLGSPVVVPLLVQWIQEAIQ